MSIVAHSNMSRHEQIVHSVWSALTRPKDGLPVSRKACAILLSLVTVQPPRVILLMRLDDVDFERSIWHAPARDKRPPYSVPLTRIAVALIGQAHAFKKDRDGHFLFPGCFDPKAPMAKAVLTRTFRRAKLAPTRLIKRPGYDLPVAAAWVMAEAGVDADDIRAVMHRVSQHELLRLAKFVAPEDRILSRTRGALETFETALMRIVGLQYSDPLFDRPKDFPGAARLCDVVSSKKTESARKTSRLARAVYDETPAKDGASIRPPQRQGFK